MRFGLVRLHLPFLVLPFAFLLGGLASASTASDGIRSLLEAGDVDGAVASGRAAVKASPEDPDLHAALANALAAKGRHVERVVDVAVRPDGGDEIRLNLGRIDPDAIRSSVVYDRTLLEEAIDHVREAIRLAPKRRDLRLGAAFLLTDAGEIERAAEAIRQALLALPRDAELGQALASYGSERLKRGDAQGGAILLGVVAAFYPDDASLRSKYALALARDGKAADASREIGRAAKTDAGSLEVQRSRAVVGLLTRDWDLARRGYEGAHALSGNDADRLGAAAARYAEDPAAAEAAFRDLAAPSASADPALVEIATAFAEAAGEGGAGPSARALAARLEQAGQPLLALPVADRILAEDPSADDATRILQKILVELGADRLALGVSARGAVKPSP